MPLRPDLPSSLNLSRRAAAPVKLPRMTFPMAGAPAEGAGGGVPEGFETPDLQQEHDMAGQQPVSDPTPVSATPDVDRVIVYGRSNCPACLEAVQDLIDRQVSFSYLDVARDATALQHLQAICGGVPVVPVIIHIGFRGT